MQRNSPPAGHKNWFIADGFIPAESTNGNVSHESVCLLNTTDSDASVTFTVYYADQEPLTSEPVTLPARRTYHIRTNEPTQLGGLNIPKDVPYAIAVRSSVPVWAQYSRLDTTQGAYTLMTTIPAGKD